MIKLTGIVEVKPKEFIEVRPIMPYQNSSCIMGSKIYGDSSAFTHYEKSSNTRFRIVRVYADIKIASSTKINHIMVSSTDAYSALLFTKIKN